MAAPRRRNVAVAAAPAASQRGLVIVVVVLACIVLACARAVRNVRRAALTMLDPAVRKRAMFSADRSETAAMRSGDIVFVSFNNHLREYPAAVRPLMQRIIVHTGVVLEHPTHGLCFVDSFMGPHRPLKLHSLVPDAFQGASVENGSVRVLPLAPLLQHINGCVWVRRLDPRVRVDVAAMWAAVAATNASRVRNAFATKMLPRASAWVARVLLDAPAPPLDLVPRGEPHTITCLQWVAAFLGAGGLWALARHPLDAELLRTAPPNPQQLAANWAAVSQDPMPPPRCSAAFALSSDFSSKSRVDFAQRFWGEEEFVPCDGCVLRGFGAAA